MRWGYVKKGDSILPLVINAETHCHALITGSSGSGKSYTLLYLVGCLLQAYPEIEMYFCDFKNSQDFTFFKDSPHYYSGNDSYSGVMEFYEKFCSARSEVKMDRRHILIFDEYPAFINYLTMKDKQEKSKKAGDVLGAIAEVLMLGRGLGYGTWIITQRADATLFANGARDNFMIIIGLGRMSREQKGMIFAGEDLPEKIYHQGEGCLLADGYPIQEYICPKISNIVDWKKHIKQILLKE